MSGETFCEGTLYPMTTSQKELHYNIETKSLGCCVFGSSHVLKQLNYSCGSILYTGYDQHNPRMGTECKWQNCNMIVVWKRNRNFFWPLLYICTNFKFVMPCQHWKWSPDHSACYNQPTRHLCQTITTFLFNLFPKHSPDVSMAALHLKYIRAALGYQKSSQSQYFSVDTRLQHLCVQPVTTSPPLVGVRVLTTEWLVLVSDYC